MTDDATPLEPIAEIDRIAALGPPSAPIEVRERLVDLLRRNLIGPHPERDPDLVREVIAGEAPSNWYLTGYLVPHPDGGHATPSPEDAAQEELIREHNEEGMADASGDGLEGEADSQPPRRTFLPSSLGLTVVVPDGEGLVEAHVTWGDYSPQPPLADALVDAEAERPEGAPHRRDLTWHRRPGAAQMTVRIGENCERPIPGSNVRGGALELVVRWGTPDVLRCPGEPDLAVRRMSAFVVNRRPRVRRGYDDVVNAHQVRLELRHEPGFASTPDITGYGSADSDASLADLHYRDVPIYGAGHNTSIGWDEGGELVTALWTEPLPAHEVPPVNANVGSAIVELGMEALARAADDAEALRDLLSPLPRAYAEWARAQAEGLDDLAEARRDRAQSCLEGIETARTRIESGIARLVGDAATREAFSIANRAVAAAARQRVGAEKGLAPSELDPPRWRLFQLAFMLLNLDGLAERTHEDRATVDLLFFPTGGGKTEAYLGLAAIAIAHRRLRHPGLRGAGLSVLMRYTLRLLTLDQLTRAAGVVCALELERIARIEQGDPSLGTWPIEIGLWVGGGVTPNRLGGRGDKKEGTLVKWLADMKKGGPPPIPMPACPWCGEDLLGHPSVGPADVFAPRPTKDDPRQLDILCHNIDCTFHGRRLPVVTVDEDIYRRLPAFMIATVDKFAALPWEGRAGAFFGHVTREDARRATGAGFYGPAEPNKGTAMDAPLPPPNLIIQDELHLISGPLGTIAGLYEVAFDLLASRHVNGEPRGPKIVASTATVRQAADQVGALFGRGTTAVFPPPGPSRDDSFFAATDRERRGRLYVGVGAPGVGPKRMFLQALQTLLAGAQAMSTGAANDPADAYLTAMCYFNALRELGGARRIVEDEVRRNLSRYGARQRQIPAGAPFVDRRLLEPVELTSRVSTDKVAEARKLLSTMRAAGGPDVALATNMISVGLDIPRLGLMILQGQPKTASEYIQATSRVGRDSDRPGLVVALLNLHRPRDRSHYERFGAFHASFYRAVEPTGITPFATRAMDRALAATVVAAARHAEEAMTSSPRATDIADHPHLRDILAAALRARVAAAGEPRSAADLVERRMVELMEAWERIAEAQAEEGLRYDGREDGPGRLLRDPLRPLEVDERPERNWFPAARSMRETEPVALLDVVQPSGRPFQTAGARR